MMDFWEAAFSPSAPLPLFLSLLLSSLSFSSGYKSVLLLAPSQPCSSHSFLTIFPAYCCTENNLNTFSLELKTQKYVEIILQAACNSSEQTCCLTRHLLGLCPMFSFNIWTQVNNTRILVPCFISVCYCRTTCSVLCMAWICISFKI